MRNNKFCLIAVVAILFISSCQRSEFATTTRHYSNGRVTFTNHYSLTSVTPYLVKPLPQQVILTDSRSIAVIDILTDRLPEITRIKPVNYFQGEKLLASVSMVPAFIISREPQRVLSDTPVFTSYEPLGIAAALSKPDTTVKAKEKSPDGPTPVETRKNEQHAVAALTFSLFGLFPILGLPFAIIGLVLGAKSLRRIHKEKPLYQGKGYAITSVILGALGIIGSVLLIALFIALVVWGNSSKAG